MENRLKEIRLKAGLTQDQLGELVGCSGQQIQYLETGKRNLTEKWMKRLAGPLRIMPHELMYENSAEVVEGDKEKALLENFRQMSERDQAVYLASAKAFLAEGSDDLKKKDITEKKRTKK